MENKLVITVPNEYQKNYERVLELVQEVDLIVEVADARIPYSATNLLNYQNTLLQKKERMIILTHVDLADEKETKKWINYFKQQNINCQLLQIDEKISNENAALFWKKNKQKFLILENKKVAVIGLPNSGKTTIIKKFLADTTVLENASELDIIKIDVSKYLVGTEIIDTPPILGINYTNVQQYWHLQMVKSISIPENFSILAVKLFSLLLKKYRSKLEKFYSLSLPSSVNSDEVLNLFLKIFAHSGKVNFDITDFDLYAAAFLQDIYQSDKILNYTLEWVNDYKNPN